MMMMMMMIGASAAITFGRLLVKVIRSMVVIVAPLLSIAEYVKRFGDDLKSFGGARRFALVGMIL